MSPEQSRGVNTINRKQCIFALWKRGCQWRIATTAVRALAERAVIAIATSPIHAEKYQGRGRTGSIPGTYGEGAEIGNEGEKELVIRLAGAHKHRLARERGIGTRVEMVENYRISAGAQASKRCPPRR